MRLDPDRDLSESTVELINSLIQSPAEKPGGLDEQLLARFLADWCTPAEREQVVDALTKSPALRKKVLEMRTSPAVEAMKARATSLTTVASGTVADWSRHLSWADLVAHATDEARAALNVLRSLAAATQTPQFATHRSSTGLTVQGLPAGITARITHELVGNDLEVVAAFVDSSGLESTALDSKSLALSAVLDEENVLDLGSALVAGSRWNLTVPDYGTLLGDDAERLPLVMKPA